MDGITKKRNILTGYNELATVYFLSIMLNQNCSDLNIFLYYTVESHQPKGYSNGQ